MEALNEQLVQIDRDHAKIVLAGQKLRATNLRHNLWHNLFVTETRDTNAVKKEIIDL